MKAKAILLDTTYCTGCNTCAYRCIQEYRTHDAASRGNFRTFVQINDAGLYHRRCMHCLDPDCVKNCPVQALTRTEYGTVLYDKDKCIGCQTCVRTCPFHVPQFDATTRKITKCSLCAHRVTQGKTPACVEVCPTGALVYGDYEEMLAEARKRAAKEKLQIYGAKENGGTHLFVLAAGDPVKMGYPKVAGRALSKARGAGVDAGVPVHAALAVTGFKKFSDRRTRVQAETEKKHDR